MENKKGSTVLVIILLIVLVGAGGYIFYQTKSYSDLDKKYNDVNTKYTELNKSSTEKVEDNSLKEGYVVLNGEHQDSEYHVYGIKTYVDIEGLIVGYQGSLYEIQGEYSSRCMTQIPTATFDANGDYQCNMQAFNNTKTTIHKFKGKESDLAKVVYGISAFSTSGYPTSVVIYKDGSVESTEEFETALKDYKIKNLLSVKCAEFDSNRMCTKGSYEVMLQDGTTQNILK